MYISIHAFIILVAIIPASAAVSIFVSRKIRRLTKVERDTEASVTDVLTRAVQAFKVVKAFGLQMQTTRAFSNSLEDALVSGYRKYGVVRLLQGVGDLTMVGSDVCSIFVGSYLVFRNQMTLGSFIAFMNAFWRSASTLIAIFNKAADLHGYSATVERLALFLSVGDANPLASIGTGVFAQDLAFSYDEQVIISELSISIRPGEHHLIIGHNGSGKTTLANILSGLLAPSSGRLEIPEKISAITLPLHFPPIPLCELPITKRLLAAFSLDDSNILRSRPDCLSAGQQQKIALGLALSQDADFYVLDEPLANLDSASRTAAMREILDITKGRMLVMIMHDADEYISMFDGILRLGISHPAFSAEKLLQSERV